MVDEWRAKSARVVIFGAGEHTRLLDRCTVMKRANIVGVVDSSPSRQGCEIMGSKIQAPSAIPALRPDVVVISSAAYQEEIYRSLAGLEAQGISIVRLYENSKQPS
ncbi:MAG: hypothetical protein IPL39_12300 [Opitutaceae bacterium]|nr:hypothetical protein [Opitutaceae bacterium]